MAKEHQELLTFAIGRAEGAQLDLLTNALKKGEYAALVAADLLAAAPRY